MITLTRVKQATQEFIKVLRFGKYDVQTSDPCLPHGIDSKPVKEDLAVHSETSNNRETVILGYIKKFDNTQEGETRIYATDQNGIEVFDIYLKNNGTCEFGGNLDNMVRYSKLAIAFNQLKSELNAFVSVFNAHVHPIPLAQAIFPASIPPSSVTATSGVPSTADISPAKIDEIKTM